MKTDLIVTFLKNEFEVEEKNGFPRLSRIPDTNARRFLCYFSELSKSDAELLKIAIAKSASKYILSAQDAVQLTDVELQTLENLRLGPGKMGACCNFISLKLLKMLAGAYRKKEAVKPYAERKYQIPENVLSWIDKQTTCKAVSLRKLVKQACASRFGFVAENRGAGVWVYRQADGLGPFELEIDYGGTWGQQLRYSVVFRGHIGVAPRSLRFEEVFGAGIGDWDFITEATANQDIALLLDLVDYYVNFPARLAEVVG